MNNNDLIESLESAIILIDRERIVRRVNIATETLFCQSRRSVLNAPLSNLIPNDEVEACIAQCFEQHAQFTLREIAIDVLGRDKVLIDITLSALIVAGKVPSQLLIEIKSVNRISHFMKEKNQLERQHSFRLMMRGLAHEIKNPLGGIRGAAQLLDRELGDPSQKELTDILIKEADRLTRLVDRVMGSRAQLKPERLNVHEVLEHVVHLVSVRYSEQLRVERFYDPALPEITVDKEQLIQAVLNIVGNAIESQLQRDIVEIGLITRFDRLVTINHKMHRQVLKIQIWDSGPGVVEELRDNLFDPLITSRPEGTGLGLSITQEIVNRHKGVVKLEDYRGKTCFTIYLPYLNNEKTEEGVA